MLGLLLSPLCPMHISGTRSVLAESGERPAPRTPGDYRVCPGMAGCAILLGVPVSDQTYEAICVRELVRRAVQNDEEAWDALLDRYAGRVWGIVRSHPFSYHDAQDITQTVLCNLAEHLHRLRDPGLVGAWLSTVTRNECRRHLRVLGRVEPLPAEELDRPDHRTPESIHLATEQVDRVRSALARLAQPESAVARLDLDHPGLPRTEVARLAGLAESEVPRVRRRARRHLYRLLKENH